MGDDNLYSEEPGNTHSSLWRIGMANMQQIPPVLLARASVLLFTRRVHIPKNKLGDIVQKEENGRFRITYISSFGSMI
jgi:hypothetical protein